MTEALVDVRGLSRSLRPEGGREQTILHDVSFSIPNGQFVALTGPSGSGKSTLLYLLGALDRASSGEIRVDGVELGALDDDERAEFRNERLGFVFQFHYLLGELTAMENVTLPMMRRGLSKKRAQDRASSVLSLLGLSGLHERLPRELSGGEQQRVAIARAVANEPALLLADEPTGNLDSNNAREVVDIFRRLTREQGCTIVMVTHDPRLSGAADRRLVLLDGKLTEDG